MKLVTMLPFMESEEIKELALKVINKEVKGIKLVVLYPFLRREDLDEIVELCIEKGLSKELNWALPFVSKKTIEKIYEGIKDGSLKGIKEHMLFPFLGKEQRKTIFDDLVKQAQENASDDDDDELNDEDFEFDVEDEKEEE